MIQTRKLKIQWRKPKIVKTKSKIDTKKIVKTLKISIRRKHKRKKSEKRRKIRIKAHNVI